MALRTAKGTCVDDQTSRAPVALSSDARTPRVSMGMPATRG